GGRILTAAGLGIRNAQITITFPTGETRAAKSTAFGYYRFAEIPSGATYVISVAAKRFAFSNATQIRVVEDETLDLDFVADE
ncbi:MAG TPA: carboxypeptidase-like regulatory domain-containing protein, partial [Pyrinomonadaceae bacterium]